MTLDKLFPLLRTLLSAIGAYILGVNIFGHAIDLSLWQVITGGVMAAVGIVLSVVDKTLSEEKLEGFLRQVVTVGGGLLVAWGKIKTEVVTAIIAAIPIISAYIQGVLSRKKNAGLTSGAISTSSLKK